MADQRGGRHRRARRSVRTPILSVSATGKRMCMISSCRSVPSGVDLLVRASWNRRVDHPERYLWDKVAAPPVVATLTVRVPRREAQPARQATVTVRWSLVLLCPPTHRRAEKLPTLAALGRAGREDHPPSRRGAGRSGCC